MKKIMLCLLVLCLLCGCGGPVTPERQPIAPVDPAPSVPVAPPMPDKPAEPSETAPPPGPSEGPDAPIQIDPTVSGEQPPAPSDVPVEPVTPPDAPAVPVPPEEVPPVEQPPAENLCSLTIRCDLLVNNDQLDPEKMELIPQDGLLCAFEQVEFEPGESVFNVLQRTLKQNKLHLEFSTTPLYNTAYIEGICNLYQFDAGSLSGWMYAVNGQFPLTGCSNTLLQPGDEIVWHFTCDLGADLGVDGFTGYVD